MFHHSPALERNDRKKDAYVVGLHATSTDWVDLTWKVWLAIASKVELTSLPFLLLNVKPASIANLQTKNQSLRAFVIWLKSWGRVWFDLYKSPSSFFECLWHLWKNKDNIETIFWPVRSTRFWSLRSHKSLYACKSSRSRMNITFGILVRTAPRVIGCQCAHGTSIHIPTVMDGLLQSLQDVYSRIRLYASFPSIWTRVPARSRKVVSKERRHQDWHWWADWSRNISQGKRCEQWKKDTGKYTR